MKGLKTLVKWGNYMIKINPDKLTFSDAIIKANEILYLEKKQKKIKKALDNELKNKLKSNLYHFFDTNKK